MKALDNMSVELAMVLNSQEGIFFICEDGHVTDHDFEDGFKKLREAK